MSIKSINQRNDLISLHNCHLVLLNGINFVREERVRQILFILSDQRKSWSSGKNITNTLFAKTLILDFCLIGVIYIYKFCKGEIEMKVLLINGSPHPKGCTFTALTEVAKTLEEEGIATSIFQLGTNPVRGCIACYKCKTGNAGCVFDDEKYNEAHRLIGECDGLIVGSPVYYAGPNGALCALMDRLFFSSSAILAGKPGAAVVSCRRGGASSSFDRLNKYFTINQMPLVTSQYWNSVQGNTPEEVRQDLEGLQTMRTLGRNMAFILKSLKTASLPKPKVEECLRTNFIR